jgi:hypothetical protein
VTRRFDPAADLARLPRGARPRPLAMPVLSRQRLYCRHRGACLRVAARADWKALDCSGCRAYERQSIVTIRDEQVALAALALWVEISPALNLPDVTGLAEAV